MDNIIEAKCPSCGEIELEPGDVDLQWCSHAPASFYRFACPDCATVVTRHADGGVAQLLIAAGVRPTLWHVPEEALEPHEGPPFTVDDLIDFHQLLGSDDWFDVVRRVPGARPQAAA